MMLKVNCELKKGTTKLGKEYLYLYIEDLDKVIFLNKTEVKLLEILYKNEK